MRIIGICLVRNEDIHLDRAVANAREFCDRVLIADHQSDDRTPEIAEAWAARDPRVEYRRIGHPRESQDWILPFVNTPTWVFGFDGDEIYDPAGLARLRADLLAGRYDAYPRINGHVLHCTSLDIAAGVAAGYMAPPSRTMTKLYNFRAISEWRGPAPERLHGGRVTFNPGYEGVANLDMHEQTDWGHSPQFPRPGRWVAAPEHRGEELLQSAAAAARRRAAAGGQGAGVGMETREIPARSGGDAERQPFS